MTAREAVEILKMRIIHSPETAAAIAVIEKEICRELTPVDCLVKKVYITEDLDA